MKNKLNIIFNKSKIQYLLTNIATETITVFEVFNIDLNTNLTLELERFVNQLALKPNSIHEVNLISCNLLNTWVPDELYSENKKQDLIKYNIKTFNSDTVTSDYIENLNIHNIHITNNTYLNFFKENFNEVNIYNIHTPILSLTNKIENKHNTQISICIKDDLMFLNIISNNKVLFINSFKFESPNDILYYTLFTFEQLKIIPDQTSIILIEDYENLKIKQLLENYILEIKQNKTKQNERINLNQLILNEL